MLLCKRTCSHYFQEEERLRKEQEQKDREEAEIKTLRKQAVHRAKAIPNFKTFDIKKSEVPLTIPETPNLQVKQRANARLENSRLENSRLENSRLENSRLNKSRLQTSRLHKSNILEES